MSRIRHCPSPFISFILIVPITKLEYATKTPTFPYLLNSLSYPYTPYVHVYNPLNWDLAEQSSARGTPKYRLPILPPSIPLIIRPSPIVRVRRYAPDSSGSLVPMAPTTPDSDNESDTDEKGTEAAAPPPWVSSRPSKVVAEEVDKKISRPPAVVLAACS